MHHNIIIISYISANFFTVSPSRPPKPQYLGNPSKGASVKQEHKEGTLDGYEKMGPGGANPIFESSDPCEKVKAYVTIKISCIVRKYW